MAAEPLMRARLTFGLVILSVRLLGPIQASEQPAAVQPMIYETQQWHAVDITLTSSWAYGNSFLEVEVTAVFISPTGRILMRPGFWDGGTTWKVRMAPTEPGLWRYHIAASDRNNPGLNPPDGEVLSLATSNDLPIYQHGFLQVSANHRYLTYADGTPFFWLADTHWFFDTRERWDSANKPGWTSEFKGMVDRRVAQGFTVYQATVFGIYGQFWAPGLVGEVIAPEYFHSQLDRKVQYLADHGLVLALSLGWNSNIDGQTTAHVRFAKYIVARYGAYPMVWTTAGEVSGYDPALRQARLDAWRQVAIEIDRDDGYHQPQTVHYTHGWPTDYQGENWLDFTMVQSAHGALPSLSVYAKYYDASPAIPLLEGELNYEQIFPNVDEAMVRASAYRAIQAGSFGYSYGAEGIWNATWDPTDTAGDLVYAHVNWYNAIDFPGAQQMGYLAAFYTRIPWQTLVPRPSGWATWTSSAPDPAMPVLKADDAAENVVVYFPDSYNPDANLGAIGPLPKQPYQIRWFNPRTGRYTNLGTAAIQDGQWVVETKADAGDWLLWLHADHTDQHRTLRVIGTNLALNQSYQASSAADSARTPASLAFDGNPVTAWQAAAGLPYSQQWLEVDFGSPVTINTAAILEGGNHTRAFQLEALRDGQWAVVTSGTLINGDRPDLLTFADVTTTAARLHFAAGVGAPAINELAFYRSPLVICDPPRPPVELPPGANQAC